MTLGAPSGAVGLGGMAAVGFRIPYFALSGNVGFQINTSRSPTANLLPDDVRDLGDIPAPTPQPAKRPPEPVPSPAPYPAGSLPAVLSEFVEPDFARLYDEARVDFILDYLRREAAEVVGDEVVEVGQHAGRFVRAVARTAQGRGVAAIVVPDGERSTRDLENELDALKAELGETQRMLRQLLQAQQAGLPAAEPEGAPGAGGSS